VGGALARALAAALLEGEGEEMVAGESSCGLAHLNVGGRSDDGLVLVEAETSHVADLGR